jgi:trans-2,3-dihydro-3-hydroxyanthranilate isomerase
MRYRYLTADVFTSVPFGGNQLAVFPEAEGIAEHMMPRIAQEFNFSETTFVFPPSDPAHAARLRIFTPGGELPFAGHPTVGTAHVLASIGRIPLTGDRTDVILEEKVGPVPVSIRAVAGVPTFVQLSAAKRPEISPAPADRPTLARALGLDPDMITADHMNVETVSCGVPFLLIPLRDRAALARARVNLPEFERALAAAVSSNVFLFAVSEGEEAIRARMFAPTLGVPEDPATGSAAVALAAYLAARHSSRSGTLRWVVEQGVEMGRASRLEIEADKQDGAVVATRVGGASVIMCDGTMDVP